MFDKCRIGKQFRRVRESLLNVTGTTVEEEEEEERSGKKPEKVSRNTEAEDGTTG